MKKVVRIILYFTFIFAVSLLVNCSDSEKKQNNGQQSSNADKEKMPEISFRESEHNFGKVTQGERVGWFFYFTNTGGQDLIIQNVSSSCGCTIPDYSKEPIPPGGEGRIKVIYNSTGRNGFDTKYVTVVSNASNSNIRLKLEVEIIKKSNI
jgi:hypothetical protein